MALIVAAKADVTYTLGMRERVVAWLKALVRWIILWAAEPVPPSTPERRKAHGQARQITEIMGLCATYFGCDPDDLLTPSRRQPIAKARQVAMAMVREQTPLSLPAIGREFGGRDHTTVLHACRKVAETPELRAVRDELSLESVH